MVESEKTSQTTNRDKKKEGSEMLYAGELSLLLDVFKKSHIAAQLLEQDEWQSSSQSDGLSLPDIGTLIRDVLPMPRPRTVYRLTDSYSCSYHLLLLADAPIPTLLCIGPYLFSPVTPEQLLQIEETNSIPPQHHAALSEHYASLTVLSSDSHLFTLLHAFCERMWRSPSYAVKDITGHRSSPDAPLSKGMLQAEPDDTLMRMRSMERRYAFENEIIHAVRHGHVHLEDQLFTALSDAPFEKRLPDLVRNAQNYCIIMNTLLRKAAEQGGVHPLQIDRTSSEIAAKIEGMTSLSESAPLMRHIFRTYCLLVRDHSLQRFSTVVKQTVLMIESDLSAELAPARLAAAQRISLGYLCSVFKRETGRTLSEYIRERRMEYAAYLLRTTELQIQTVALHCGIMDIQYFSKLFKRQFGTPPTQYRLARKRES